MRSTKHTKETIKQWLHVSASPETRDRIWREVLSAQEQYAKTKSTFIRPNLWRIIMKSPLTKFSAAAVIIITALPLVLFFLRGATSVYALEQTIEANHTIKTVHLRIVEGDQNIENNEFSDCWVKYDDAGLVSNFRCNIYEDGEDRAYAVWNEGVLKIWRPSQNVVIVIRVNDMEKYWEHFAREYDPKLIFQWLYVSRRNAAAQLQINELSEDGHSVYVTATHSIDKTRLELVIDPKTKLVKELSRYRLGEKEDQLDTQIEVVAYNQSIDPSMFKLSGIPDDALVVDQVDQLVGLEQGNLTNNEIVVKVVRETLEATIAKDYEKVSRLMEGVPGDTVEEFIKEEFDARLAGVTSIGQPEPHERSGYHIYVPCEIEVENEERGKWTVNIRAMTEFINYQDGRRWVMHCPDKDDGSRISTNSTIDAQDGTGEKLIIPGERVGDFRFGISKDEVLRRLGKPKMIFLGGERYTLNNLPNRYYMAFGGISFRIDGDIVTGITALSPLYKFTNGLGVGDSEQKIKQTFGDDFQLEEGGGKDFLIYEDKGLHFEIHTEDRTVMEINITQTSSREREGSSIQPVPSIKPFEDVRAKDLSNYDLSAQEGLITKLQFNRETVWPERAKIPPGSDPEKILTDAMNPGLGIRELHRQGITGKGVNLAIIDQPLFKDHPEYNGKIAAYYDTGCDTDNSSMHGPAVASLLVGTNCGTAPGARIYYVAAPSWKADAAFYAKGLEWIIEQNGKLPEADKIRVVSVSAAPSGPGSPFKANQGMWDAAVKRAEADGIMVLDCTQDHGFIGPCWCDIRNREDVTKCTPGFPGRPLNYTPDGLATPSSCRTTAQHYDYHGRNSYIYWGRGGLSWSIPYCAGVLALGWQIRPDLPPAQMKELLFASAYAHESGAKVIHPTAFIDLVRKQGDNQNVQSSGVISFAKIDRKAKPGSGNSRVMNSLPKYDPDSDNPFQIDCRRRDLSKLDLSHSIDDLLYATFDDRTIWPASDKMPHDFDWQKIMEHGKNPGLGVRRLHEKGITGRGVRIAILDQPLLVDHQEYAERVRLYEEIDLQGRTDPAMHGAAVASIALGKTVGVAPEAELYYIAKYNFDRKGKVTMRYIAQGINRILEINEQLPKDNRIRVISISRGWGPSSNGYDDVTAACEKAKAVGVFIVSCSLERVYGFEFHGMGRQPLANPDVFESYEPGLWWAKSFYDSAPMRGSDRLLVPMDSRTTASPAGNDEYVFYRQGGWSWSVPYIAGVYALAAQAEPDITPERFWNLALKTGRTIQLEHEGEKRPFGLIVDPVRLIRSISGDGAASQRAPSKNIIVPGVRVGNYTLDMSKDDILKELGEPEAIYSIHIEGDEMIRRREEEYSLDNLPEHYILSFRDVSFWMDGDSIEVISVQNPLYQLSNGLGVGDSEQKIKQAFSEDFKLEKVFGKDFHCYHAKGLGFQMHEKNQTIAGIVVYQPEDDDRDDDSSEQDADSTQTIVPGVGMGDYTLDMNKDDVLNKLGKPKNIHYGGEDYTLDNLPNRYFLFYHGISFHIDGEAVTGISAHSSRYKFANGLKVGDSKNRIIQTFGNDFELEEHERIDFLTYKDKGLHFEIDKNGTIREICVNRTKRNQSNINIPKVHRRDDLGPFEDVSGKDLRDSDLRYSEDILDTLEFNQETQWPLPERLPEGFDPQVLLQEGMNPGLGVRDLHTRGITGAGVHVGLIDQPLLLDHPEYTGKIVSYHALDCGPHKSSMHGPAMASQLVGERCGTAPGASLHVVAVPSWKADAAYYAKALDRFVAYNENAPKEQKIRVVSVSCQPSGEGSVFENQPLWDEAVQRAQARGILVLDCTWHHGFVSLCWLDPEDRENVEACTPGFRLGEVEVDEGHIHVPSAPRTAAEADEDRSFGYAYDGGGRRSRRPKAKNGYSDTIPYTAGILALGWQIRPDLTPAQIKEMLFASAYVHESGAKIIHPTAFIDLVRSQSSPSASEGVCKEDSETLTIVPGVGVGDYTPGMSKDDVLSKLGEPEVIQLGEDEVIRRGQKKYNLNDLPREYILSFRDVSFWFENDSVQVISVHSPLYKLGNGLGVGDSEQKIKQAFGEGAKLQKAFGKGFFCYHAKGIGFEIHEKNRIVAGIIVYRTEGGGDPDVPDSAEAALVRKAAAEGRIAYKLTTPDEFKAITGKPTREWTESNGEVIWMKYPGMRVNFFGKPDVEIPHTLNGISCEGREIDIGQNRPIVLRDEGDLHKLGSFWGFSNVDLSRLDLSQQGDLLNRTTFDSLTVWPPPDRLPPGFDPVKRLEWGKNPGLGVRSLHREGITGKGVGIAIIDQPLLKDHVEYADRIKSYYAIEVEGVNVQMHGPPVCSMAVGKTCGVAPQASLHYYAVPPWKWIENRPWARTVEQIVERNKDLPPSEKVRVISISLGAFSGRDYFDRWKSAVNKAHRNGILVVTCDRHFLRYVTLERLVGKDPDDPNNYYFDSGVNALYVPASNRSMASHRGKDVYTFDTVGGNSWTVPYLAGLAAMAFQVHPDISPDRMVTLFQETATQTKQGRVINPRGFIEAVKGL